MFLTEPCATHLFCLPPPSQLLHPDEEKRIQTVEQLEQLRFFEELSLEEVRQKKVTPTFIPPVSEFSLCMCLLWNRVSPVLLSASIC